MGTPRENIGIEPAPLQVATLLGLEGLWMAQARLLERIEKMQKKTQDP